MDLLGCIAKELVKFASSNQALIPPRQLASLIPGLSEDEERRRRTSDEAEGQQPRPSRENNYLCPFIRNPDGTYAVRFDPLAPPSTLHNTAILASHVLAKPLPEAKRQQYVLLKSLEPAFRPKWAAENGDLGTVLPPYHLAIALRMALSAPGRFFWMFVDKTDEGVRIKIAPEEQQSVLPEELKPNASTVVAEFVRKQDYEHEVLLFDVVEIVVDDAKPASLETHISEATRIKEAIIGFASTHCWELVMRIVALFDPDYNFGQAFDVDTGRLLVRS
jgi:hypothetical protein